MSYEPTLIINKTELQKREQDLSEFKENVPFITREAYKYLHNILVKYAPVEIQKVQYYVGRPESSRLNKAVRKQLTDWNIEYVETD